MIDLIREITTSYSVAAKLVLLVSATVFFLTLFFGRIEAKREPATDGKGGNHHINQKGAGIGRDAYNFQESHVTIVQPSQEKDNRPLKERIRSYLRKVNPKIVESLDSGQSSIAVMINIVNQQSLLELQQDPDFGAYLEVRNTGSVSAGANNTIGGHLNDLQDVGVLNGYELIFKDRLRLK